jgi:hypothetical protein
MKVNKREKPSEKEKRSQVCLDANAIPMKGSALLLCDASMSRRTERESEEIFLMKEIK